MPAKMKFFIPQEKLEKLYFKKKWSIFQIADFYGCTHGTVVERFKRYGLKSRGHLGITPPLLIPKAQLIQWYEKDELSIKQIAEKIGRSKGGVERLIRKYGIKLRGNEHRKHWKYVKKPFSGNFDEKAYMIGFRLGDLNVYRRKQVIVVRGSTTKRAQVKLFTELFHDYGGVNTTYAKRGTIEQYAFLDRSFEFLVPKTDHIPEWIESCPKCFLSFFAGYFDAGGSALLHKSHPLPFGGFEIQSYDKNVLLHSWEILKKLGVACPKPSISTRKGYVDKRGVKHNGDTWRLSIFAKESVWISAHYLKKTLRHGDKIAKLNLVKENIMIRNIPGYSRKIISLKEYQLPLHNHMRKEPGKPGSF